MKASIRFCVAGGGSWGTALAHLLAGLGYDVRLWLRDGEAAERINQTHENARYLPGLPLHPALRAETDPGVLSADYLVLAIPTQQLRGWLEAHRRHLNASPVLINAAKEDKSDILTEVFRSKAVLLGSPTYNHGYLYSIAGMIEIIKGSAFKNKKGAAFGSYGWSGEAVKKLSDELTACGFEVVDEGLKGIWVPDDAMIENCRKYGYDFAKKISE